MKKGKAEPEKQARHRSHHGAQKNPKREQQEEKYYNEWKYFMQVPPLP